MAWRRQVGGHFKVTRDPQGSSSAKSIVWRFYRTPPMRTRVGDHQYHDRSSIVMGKDMAGVLKKLGYDKVDVLGYSMGGGVAFQLAAQHPKMVRRLALVWFYPEILPQQAALGAAMAEQMKENADLQIVRGICAASGRISEAARPGGRVYA